MFILHCKRGVGHAGVICQTVAVTVGMELAFALKPVSQERPVDCVYGLTNSCQGLYNILLSSSHSTHSFQLTVTETKQDAGVCFED